MSKCTNCQATLKDNDKFCEECGTPISKEKTITISRNKLFISVGVLITTVVLLLFFKGSFSNIRGEWVLSNTADSFEEIYLTVTKDEFIFDISLEDNIENLIYFSYYDASKPNSYQATELKRHEIKILTDPILMQDSDYEYEAYDLVEEMEYYGYTVERFPDYYLVYSEKPSVLYDSLYSNYFIEVTKQKSNLSVYYDFDGYEDNWVGEKIVNR